jgi:hypothetical protein
MLACVDLVGAAFPTFSPHAASDCRLDAAQSDSYFARVMDGLRLDQFRKLAVCFSKISCCLTAGLVIALAGISPVGAERLHGFGPSTLIDVEVDIGATVDRVAGDFNGDGLTDLARIHKRTNLGLPDGAVTVWPNTDGEFGTPANWHGSFVTGSEIVLTGDVNGDNLDDLIAFTRGSSADVFVALSNGSGFGAKTKWHDAFCVNNELPLVGDVTGDGRDDIVTLTRDTSATVFVATSNGSSFTGNGWLWHSVFCPGEAGR